jgi:hypothetical protein
MAPRDWQEGWRREVTMLNLVTAQHQHCDIDDGEDAEQKQRRRSAERRHGANKSDERESKQRREDDGDVGRAPACMHLAERGRQHMLAAHAIDQTARHQHVDQGGVGDREHGDEAEDVKYRDADINRSSGADVPIWEVSINSRRPLAR